MTARKKSELLIPKGKMVFVYAKGMKMEDRRFFTVSGKLKKFLRYLAKYHSNLTVKIKQFRVN